MLEKSLVGAILGSFKVTLEESGNPVYYPFLYWLTPITCS